MAQWQDTSKGVLVSDQALRCTGCGAEHLASPDLLAESCPFCEVALSRADQHVHEHAAPQGVVPFALTEAQAQDAIARMLDGAPGLPRALRKMISHPPRLTSIYLSCFTFDANLSGRYEIETRQGKNFDRHDGHASVFVDDLLIPTADTAGITASVAERMAPQWTPQAVRPYSPDYVAGFRATLPVFGITEARALAQAGFARRFGAAALMDFSDRRSFHA